MIIYIDDNFKCYPNSRENLKAIDVPFFNNKCDAFIEGYRFIPFGEKWIREDGKIFIGELIAPWKPYEELDIAQRAYEQEQYAILLAEKHSYTEAYNQGVNEA